MARVNALITLLTIFGLVAADGIYSAKSPVLQVNAKNYDALIAQSNYTSVSHGLISLVRVLIVYRLSSSMHLGVDTAKI